MSYGQLVVLGFTPGAIEHRLRGGRLHRLHKGVYAVGHAAVTGEGRELAAVLACGRGATLSHWSAAARWELLRPTRGPVDVTVAAERRHRAGIRVHHVEQLHPSERTLRDGIPVTSVPRTLLDVAALATPKALARAVNQADRLGWLNRGAIERLCFRNRGRRGIKRLRAALEAAPPLHRPHPLGPRGGLPGPLSRQRAAEPGGEHDGGGL